MMPDFSIKLIFPVSRSKNYQQAIKLAGMFHYFERDEPNVVHMGIREVFEKWEYFNLLFWRTVDWKGTVLVWNGMHWHSHTDKTRIFYALQHAHVSYICYLEESIRDVWKVPFGLIKMDELELSGYNEEDINMLIERFRIQEIENNVRDDESLKGINVKNRPLFRQNPKTS
nr:hypothetical protein [uncultured Draconibacterium sp.]